MTNISTKNIEKILQIIDQAFLMHTQWYENFVRALICKLPLPESVTGNDAHQKCNFGCWFYSKTNTSLHDSTMFKNIGELHKKMHDAAKTLCMKTKATGLAPDEDYDYFIRCLNQFRADLQKLKDKVLRTQQTASNGN